MRIADLSPQTWALNTLINEVVRRDAMFDFDTYLKERLARDVRAKGYEPLSDTFKVEYHDEFLGAEYQAAEIKLARVTCLAVRICEDVIE